MGNIYVYQYKNNQNIEITTNYTGCGYLLVEWPLSFFFAAIVF